MELQPEWNEFLRLLKHHGVRFVMVGGLAVAFHGHERFTKDLDLFVDPSEANARRLGKALVDFGFTVTGRAWRRLTRPYQILTLGVEPLRIDVLTSIGGVAFRAVWKGRERITTRAGTVFVIGLAELRANKLATADHKTSPMSLSSTRSLDLKLQGRGMRFQDRRAGAGPPVAGRSRQAARKDERCGHAVAAHDYQSSVAASGRARGADR